MIAPRASIARSPRVTKEGAAVLNDLGLSTRPGGVAGGPLRNPSELALVTGPTPAGPTVKSITKRAWFESATGTVSMSSFSVGSDSHILVPRSRRGRREAPPPCRPAKEPCAVRLVWRTSGQSQHHQHEDDDEQHADDGTDDSAIHLFLRAVLVAW